MNVIFCYGVGEGVSEWVKVWERKVDKERSEKEGMVWEKDGVVVVMCLFVLLGEEGVIYL